MWACLAYLLFLSALLNSDNTNVLADSSSQEIKLLFKHLPEICLHTAVLFRSTVSEGVKGSRLVVFETRPSQVSLESSWYEDLPSV